MVQVTLPSGGVIIGETITETPLLPWSGNVTVEAEDYRTRNSAKTFTFYRFRGIPYAVAPTGVNRWKPATMLVEPTEDPYSATGWRTISWESDGPAEAAGRPSSGVNNGAYDWPNYPVYEDEDCLNLHIWTPDVSPASSLPVVVYCHGGGNTKNAGVMYSTQGNRLVHKGVVYVTFEYRLSTWGFFHATAFAGDSGILGNYAYTDTIACLRWIQENIGVFGGDPNNVTIMGSSAGGAMVQSLMTTTYPIGETLFHRAFSMSGGGIGQRQLLADAQARGDLFLEYLYKDRTAHYDPRTIAEVQAEDGDAAALRLGPTPAQIMAWGNERTLYGFPWPGTGYTTGNQIDYNAFPIKDGTICAHDNAIEAVRAGVHRTGVPYISSSVSNEAELISNAVNLTTLDNRWSSVGIDNKAEIAEVVALYDVETSELKRQCYGDVTFSYPAYRLAYELADNGETAYLVYFSFDTEGDGREEPGHSDDVNYWLGQAEWTVGMSGNEAKVYEDDLRLCEHLTQSLANFAKHGNPNTAYTSAYDLSLYAVAPSLGGFTSFSTADHNANVIENDGDQGPPIITNTVNHLYNKWGHFNAKLGY